MTDREPWCWICDGHPDDCPYNCGELVKSKHPFEDEDEDEDADG